MAARNISGYKLHKDTGLNKSLIYKYLNSDRVISSDSLEIIVNYLNLKLV